MYVNISRRSRTAALATAAAVCLGGLSSVPASAAPVDKTLTYTCAVVDGDANGDGLVDVPYLPLPQPVPARVVASFPATVSPGDTIPEAPVQIDVDLSSLADAARITFGAYAKGTSSSTQLHLAVNGVDQAVTLQDFGTDWMAIPDHNAGGPEPAGSWVVPMAGTMPAVTIATDATGTIAVDGPSSFTIDAFHNSTGADPYTGTSHVECIASDIADLRLGTIVVDEEQPPGGGTTPVDASFDYSCAIVDGDLLDDGVIEIPSLSFPGPVAARTRLSIPDVVEPGGVIPEVLARVDLDLSGIADALRLTFGSYAKGGSTNASIRFDFDGTDKAATLQNLSAPWMLIPNTVDTGIEPPGSWIVPMAGTMPAVDVPHDASGTVTVNAPTSFTVDLFHNDTGADPHTSSSHVECDVVDSGELRLGTIEVAEPPTVDNTVLPSISGTPVVGETLTASPGTWTPGGASYAYQWLADGAEIEGATGAELVVGAAHLGTRLSVRVTASLAEHVPGTATSAQTAAVKAPIENVAVPTVSDTTPHVGQVLTATSGTWDPDDVSLSYRWLADGDVIAGAQSAALTVSAALEGKRLSVRVTASKADHVDAVETSAQTEAVAPEPAVVNTVLPSISGAPVVGETLTASPGTWTPGGASYAYQWLADGAEIEGVTGAELVVGAAHLGKRLSVRVTASLAEHVPGTVTSAQTAAVKATIENVAVPTVSDTTPHVGQVLTAAGGSWDPADVSLDYQWLADGEVIAGASSSSLPVTSDLEGARLAVRVTASKADHVDAVETSAQTEAVAPERAVVNTVLPSISGAPVVGETLTASTGAWTPSAQGFGYQWFADGEELSGATERTLVVGPSEVGKRLSVRVTAFRPDHLAGEATSEETEPVVAPIRNLTPPTVSDTTPTVGQVVTATSGTWDPDDVSLAYRWLADGEVIAGAQSAALTVSAALEGKRLSVRVTASRNAHRDAVAESEETEPVAPVDEPVPTLTNTVLPSISGTAAVGETLTASPGTWTPSGASYAYQWLVDGAAVAGDTGTSYVVRASDAGKRISVRVTASAAGMTSGVATSASTATVPKPAAPAPTPPTVAPQPTPTVDISAELATAAKRIRVKGKPKVGKSLKLTRLPDSVGGATVVSKIQWYAGSKKIRKATKAKLKLTRKLRRKKISVKVRLVVDGVTRTVRIKVGKVR